MTISLASSGAQLTASNSVAISLAQAINDVVLAAYCDDTSGLTVSSYGSPLAQDYSGTSTADAQTFFAASGRVSTATSSITTTFNAAAVGIAAAFAGVDTTTAFDVSPQTASSSTGGTSTSGITLTTSSAGAMLALLIGLDVTSATDPSGLAINDGGAGLSWSIITGYVSGGFQKLALAYATKPDAGSVTVSASWSGVNAGYNAILYALRPAASGPDTTPDAFSFVDVTGASLSTVYTSNAITVSGITSAAAISVTGGEYRINGGSWTSTSGTVENGDTVEVRGTSSGSYGASVDVVLTIGGVSDTFTISTVGPRTDASFGAGAFGAGAFGAPYIRSVDAGSSSYSGTLAESVSVVDGVSATLVANPSITETLTLADVIGQVAAMLATSAEAASVSDAVTAALVTSAVLSESQALADTLSKLMAASTSNAEPITAADQPSSSNAASATIAESVSSADAVSGSSSGTSGTLSESVAATDLITTAATMAQVLSEAIACTETVTTTGTAFSVSLSDSASSTDVWSASVSALAVAISEAIAASDTLTRTAQLSQAVNELNSLTDVLSAAGSFTVALVEAATLADAISWIDENVTPPADRIISARYNARTIAVPYQDRYLVVRYQSRTIH